MSPRSAKVAKSIVITSVVVVVVVVVLTPSLAFAHGAEHAHGFVNGFVHPLTGLDHVLAMIAVGVWAVRISRARYWLAPAAFVAGMASGLLLGATFAASALENAVALSLIGLGLLLALAIELPRLATFFLVGAAGFAHGGAHMLDAPGQTGALAFAVGALAMTALLHGLGIALALVPRTTTSAAMRAAGLSMAVVGASLLVANS